MKSLFFLLKNAMRVAIFQANPIMGDIQGNAERLLAAAGEAAAAGAKLLVAPELYLLGYPPDDLVQSPDVLAAARAAIKDIARKKPKNISILTGAPMADARGVINAAVLLHGRRWHIMSEKMTLPDYGVFDDPRVFAAGDGPGVIEIGGQHFGVMICEDIWQPEPLEKLLGNLSAPLTAVIAINASPFEYGKLPRRYAMAGQRARRAKLPFIYLNMTGGQDDLVFDGTSFVLNKNGEVTAQFPSFETGIFYVDLDKEQKTVSAPERNKWQDIYHALIMGTQDYARKNGFSKICLGLSGGLDSAIVAKIAVDALGPDNVSAMIMPGAYSNPDSMQDAHAQAKLLGIQILEAPIMPAQQALEVTLQAALGAQLNDVAGQNIQSRIRGLMLMALSNQTGALLLTTGNKSEMAVGYATLYGDMNGGFNPIKDLYKTEVYALCEWLNKESNHPVILPSIIARAPSAELKPGQKDQDTLPPYEVLDEILRALIEGNGDAKLLKKFDADLVAKIRGWLATNEYKRRQSAPGVKISRKAFGRDRRFPITNKTRV